MTIREVTGGQSGLPVPNSTKSYWLKEPSDKLLGHRTTDSLPSTADIVIVGSGITGSFAARFLKDGPAKDSSVVLLEAREACWGATGRNGGHCQPIVYASAPAVAAFELETYRYLRDLVRDNNIPCDWVGFEGIHAFLTQDLFDVACKAVQALEKDHPDLAAEVRVVKPSDSETSQGCETLASLRLPGAKGAILQKNAASLWPYKLVSWVLEQLLDKFPSSGFNLQTNTPVTNLKQVPSDLGQNSSLEWVLTTPRGLIRAKTVLLCTNAYTSRLLPAFADLIVPTRGQVAALLPPKDGESDPTQLEHSYVFVGNIDKPGSDRPAAREDYLVQRPLPTGELIFGGGRHRAKHLAVGVWHDDVVEEPVSRWLRGQLDPPLDLTPNADEKRQRKAMDAEGGEKLLDATYQWTGIMGYSRDHHPWVGAVPESLGGGDGLYISAGYTGHGMPVAALAARSVVQLIASRTGSPEMVDEVVKVPQEYQLTEHRISIARTLLEVAEMQKLGFATLFP